jgi:hypothetical protein
VKERKFELIIPGIVLTSAEQNHKKQFETELKTRPYIVYTEIVSDNIDFKSIDYTSSNADVKFGFSLGLTEE